MDQPSFPPLSCWSIIFQTSPDNFSLQRLSFSVTAGGDEREREREMGEKMEEFERSRVPFPTRENVVPSIVDNYGGTV